MCIRDSLKDDSERKVSGTMEIAIAYLFNNQGYKNLLEAKKILKKAFEGVFLTDEDTTISLVWRKSESFQEAIEGQMDVEVCGSVLTFDAYAFPKHSYLPLDAVGSLAKHIDENWNVTVINNTELEMCIRDRNMEEGSVQFAAQEISKKENIQILESQYDHMTEALRNINKVAGLFKNDYDFAMKLISVPLPDRYGWLNNIIYDKMMLS